MWSWTRGEKRSCQICGSCTISRTWVLGWSSVWWAIRETWWHVSDSLILICLVFIWNFKYLKLPLFVCHSLSNVKMKSSKNWYCLSLFIHKSGMTNVCINFLGSSRDNLIRHLYWYEPPKPPLFTHPPYAKRERVPFRK